MADFLDWTDNAFNGVNGGADMSAYVSGTTDSAWNFSMPSASSVIDTGFKAVDWGLATYDRITNAQAKVENSQLNAYLAKSSADLARTQINGQLDIGRLNAQTGVQLAQARTNAASSLSGIAAVGQNPNSLMLYLTIIGVLFAGIQVWKSR